MKKTHLLSIFLCLMILITFGCSGAQGAEERSPDVIGMAFGKNVTVYEFDYYLKTALLFTRSGKETRTEEEARLEAWQNLIFKRGAEELKISVSREELEAELKRLVKEKEVEYGTDAYKTWVKLVFNEDVPVFEHRIEDLLMINKLMELKANPDVTVTEEEVKQKFLNQHNSFESEYIKFDSRGEAEEFLKKIKKDPRLWKDTYSEKKPDGQKGAAWINIMSLEALIDLWKIPKEDAYNILSHELGDFVVAEFFYGDAVFRLLNKKEPDMAKYTDEKREYLRDIITKVKKRKLAREYFEDLLERANYKDYVAEDMRKAKIEQLKNESVVILETNRGKIKLQLFPDIAPTACENFIGLIKKGYYDGIIFHRVIKDFMIQGGDPTGTGTGGESLWGKPFINEVSDDLTFDRPGLLAMANSGPDTNTSQFFITTKKTPWLNKRHTIFGEVIAGYEVVEEISNSPTDSKDKPQKEQKILKSYIAKSN